MERNGYLTNCWYAVGELLRRRAGHGQARRGWRAAGLGDAGKLAGERRRAEQELAWEGWFRQLRRAGLDQSCLQFSGTHRALPAACAGGPACFPPPGSSAHHPRCPALPTAAPSAAVKQGKPYKREMLGKQMVVFRDSQGKVQCLDNICPHRWVGWGGGGHIPGGLALPRGPTSLGVICCRPRKPALGTQACPKVQSELCSKQSEATPAAISRHQQHLMLTCLPAPAAPQGCPAGPGLGGQGGRPRLHSVPLPRLGLLGRWPAARRAGA